MFSLQTRAAPRLADQRRPPGRRPRPPGPPGPPTAAKMDEHGKLN